MTAPRTPTARVYAALDTAFAHFDTTLFDGRLSAVECLMTLQRRRGAYGYFCADRFGPDVPATNDEAPQRTDEIALNPSHFARGVGHVLSTLVHEMTHLEQQHEGKPGKNGHHNKEWGTFMKRIGLYPSSTGAAGGKETGRKVSHYVVEGGPFEASLAALLATGFELGYSDAGIDGPKKKSGRVAHVCPDCGARARAKPEVNLVCGDCTEVMVHG